jgi:hypothetical protein
MKLYPAKIKSIFYEVPMLQAIWTPGTGTKFDTKSVIGKKPRDIKSSGKFASNLFN